MLPSVAATALKRQEASSNAYKITGFKTLLYGHTLDDSKDTAAITALGQTLLKKADDEQNAKHATTATAIKALTFSQELVGRIHEVIEILATATHDSVYFLGNSGATSNAAAERTTAGCKGKIHDLKTTADNIDDDILDENGYKTITDVENTNGVGDSNKCPFTAQAASHQTWGAGTADAEMIDGMLTCTTAEQVARSGFTKVGTANNRLTDALSITVHADTARPKSAYRETKIKSAKQR
ncbi:variant surface protein [Trypanosoma brucei equiperdum]|uniref:Variant surface protein n=1 Tax=Trypanosoma brucei equiperdum TaxID=630700 RepID=A0A3L6LBZ7_9TRYP|nr:variant surface protein [Trypanosoma brucei equiperdum]